MNNHEKNTKSERREQKKKRKMKVSGSGVKQLRRIIAAKSKEK